MHVIPGALRQSGREAKRDVEATFGNLRDERSR